MKKSYALAGLAALALFGCRYSVNLITERRSFDRYQDMIRQAQAETAAKQAFYDEATQACEDDGLDPYPRLDADLQGMGQSIAAMKEDQLRIDQFKRQYDAFAAGRAQINSDDTETWARFKALQSDFSALSEPMNQDIGRFRQQAQDFSSGLEAFQIGKINTADFGKEVDGFAAELQDGMEKMRMQVEEDGKVLKFARENGIEEGIVHRKEEILGQMREMLPALRLFRDSVGLSSRQLGSAFRGQAYIWTGPGMPGDAGKLVWDFRASRGEYWKDKKAFGELAQRFDQVKHEEPEHSHEEHKDGK